MDKPAVHNDDLAKEFLDELDRRVKPVVAMNDDEIDRIKHDQGERLASVRGSGDGERWAYRDEGLVLFKKYSQRQKEFRKTIASLSGWQWPDVISKIFSDVPVVPYSVAEALKDMGVTHSPPMDGYGSKYFSNLYMLLEISEQEHAQAFARLALPEIPLHEPTKAELEDVRKRKAEIEFQRGNTSSLKDNSKLHPHRSPARHIGWLLSMIVRPHGRR